MCAESPGGASLMPVDLGALERTARTSCLVARAPSLVSPPAIFFPLVSQVTPPTGEPQAGHPAGLSRSNSRQDLGRMGHRNSNSQQVSKCTK